jgi:hypothetical protein
MFLVVNPAFPAKTVSDLVAMAKQRPGELQYVNPGLGTPPGKLSIIGAVIVVVLMIPTAPSAQMGGAINPGVHVGGAVNLGASVRGAVGRGIPRPGFGDLALAE